MGFEVGIIYFSFRGGVMEIECNFVLGFGDFVYRFVLGNIVWSMCSF